MVVLRAAEKVGVDAYADTDAAFAEVTGILPNVLTNYNTGSEMINLFSTGEITVSMAQDFALGRCRPPCPRSSGPTSTDGDIATLNTINIPTEGRKTVDLAHMFLDFVLSAEIQQTAGRTRRRVAPVKRQRRSVPPNRRRYGPTADEMISSLNRVD